MINSNLISEQIVSSSVLPIVMIPACTLLSMIFNNRLISILAFLRKRQDNLLDIKYEYLKNYKNRQDDLEQFHYQQDQLWNQHLYDTNSKRATLLRWGIVFEYCAIFMFSGASLCTLLTYFNSFLFHIAICLLILGTLLVITGLSFGLREILLALKKFNESSKMMEEIFDDLIEKFNQH